MARTKQRRTYAFPAVAGTHLLTITETTLFPVANLLKCVATEGVLFSIVAFNTLTFHKVV